MIFPYYKSKCLCDKDNRNGYHSVFVARRYMEQDDIRRDFEETLEGDFEINHSFLYMSDYSKEPVNWAGYGKLMIKPALYDKIVWFRNIKNARLRELVLSLRKYNLERPFALFSWTPSDEERETIKTIDEYGYYPEIQYSYDAYFKRLNLYIRENVEFRDYSANGSYKLVELKRNKQEKLKSIELF